MCVTFRFIVTVTIILGVGSPKEVLDKNEANSKQAYQENRKTKIFPPIHAGISFQDYDFQSEIFVFLKRLQINGYDTILKQFLNSLESFQNRNFNKIEKSKTIEPLYFSNNEFLDNIHENGLSLQNKTKTELSSKHNQGLSDGTSGLHQTKLNNGEENSIKSLGFEGRVTGQAENVSLVCSSDTQELITAILNLSPWAINFFDSMGKPGPSLTKGRLNWPGNYAQCRSAVSNVTEGHNFNGNYCVLTFSLASSTKKPPAIGLPGLSVNVGVCFPDSCSSQDVSQVLGNALENLNLTGTLAVGAECRDDDREITAATIASIVILSILGVIVILGTSVDILSQYRKKKYSSENLGPDIETQQDIEYNHTNSEAAPLLKKRKNDKKKLHTLKEILLAFSFYTNGQKVLNTSQSPGSLSSIHGIRFLSMSWVVLGHCYAILPTFTSNGYEALPKIINDWSYDAIFNALPSVDTFFLLSGLLTAYTTIQMMGKSKKGWRINWLLFYVHRFVRLTPPYMLTLLFVLGLQRFFGQGPLWQQTQPADKSFCEKNWWTNLLYINNLVKPNEMCFAHSWFLANDMQFYIISPLMIVPLFVKAKLGLMVCGVFLVGHMIITGVLSIENDWPATILSRTGNTALYLDYYFKPWCRIGPFIVGIVTGYILAVTKGKIRMNKKLALFGWVIAAATALATVYGLREEIKGEHPLNVSERAFYNSVARSAWAVSVSWVIVACTSGYGGPVNTLLSWSPFVVLGRLTYMSYLIHPSMMFVYFGNRDVLFYINATNIVVLFLGVLVLVNMAAFVLMLLLESPVIGVEKVLLKKNS